MIKVYPSDKEKYLSKLYKEAIDRKEVEKDYFPVLGTFANGVSWFLFLVIMLILCLAEIALPIGFDCLSIPSFVKPVIKVTLVVVLCISFIAPIVLSFYVEIKSKKERVENYNKTKEQGYIEYFKSISSETFDSIDNEMLDNYNTFEKFCMVVDKEILSISVEDGLMLVYKDNDNFSVVRFDKDRYYTCCDDFNNCSVYYDEACNSVMVVDDVKFIDGGSKNE